MSLIQVAAFALMVLVICPALAGLAIWALFRLDDRGAPMLVAIGVPYLLVVGLAMLVAWPLSVIT